MISSRTVEKNSHKVKKFKKAKLEHDSSYKKNQYRKSRRDKQQRKLASMDELNL